LVAAALGATRGALWGVAGISGAANLLMLTGPLFMLQVYDRVLASRSVPTLVALSVLAIGLYVFLGILELIRTRVLTRIGLQIEEQLGGPAFEAVLTFPLRSSKKEIPSQPLRDLDQLRQFMSGPGPVAICDLPWLPIYLAIIFLFHSLLGWLAVAGAVLLVVLTLISEAVLRAPVGRVAQLNAIRSDFIDAGRRNAEALRAMGMRQAYASRWRRTNELYLAEQSRAGDATGGFSATSKVLRLALQSAVLALGAWLAIRQEISPGVMIAASILTSRALAPIEQATAQWRSFVAARQGRKRLHELLELIRDDREPMALPKPRERLDISGLFVGAPQSSVPILREIEFHLEAGQGLGIIGPSGSGKTTLARALVGVWQPLRGTIRLDGAELEQWTPEALGPSVGYLPQGVELFDGTVAENISRFSADADPSLIIEAARQAGVHELVLSLTDGYDTRVGAGGAILSAGQRQRIGLARALFGNPFLIVLDEPNASLDTDGEMALTNAILTSRKTGSIVLVIAHRPNALAAVDQVLVLNAGQQVAFGPRDEVLRKTTVRAVEKSA
jgi:PrtD family type I secretion system ABC transporter